MKTCKKCDKSLDESEFYDRHSSCKECVKVRVRQHRAANVNAAREYDRRRYYEDPARKLANANNSRKMNARHPEKRKARCAVSNALRDGRLLRQPCEVCGLVKSEAHHEDYSKPLDVRWLCKEHHMQAHHGRAS